MKPKSSDETTARTPTDGKPYYCDECGAGYGEFGACEEVDCRLESAAAALARCLVPGHSDFNCPVCDAISTDYCQLHQCRWDVVDPKGSGVSRGVIISGQ